MGFLSIDKKKELDYNKLSKIFGIINSYKINKIIDQPTEFILSYNEKQYRGNSNIELIPNKLFCLDHERLIYTDFIDISLEYFPHILDILDEYFPHIKRFINDENIENVIIKPAFNILKGKVANISNSIKKLTNITDQLLKPEYAKYLDSLIIVELIRRFYMGEQDKIKGFLVYKPNLRHLKAIFEEPLICQDIIDKMLETKTIINISDQFTGTDTRFTFKIFKNNILVTSKKDPYMKNFDLKFMYIFEKIGRTLDDTRFGKR